MSSAVPQACRSSRSWVIRKTARPRAASALSSLEMEAILAPSSPDVGSSRIRICGFLASAQAMTTRCFSPPERLCGWRSASGARRSVVRSSVTHASSSAVSFGVFRRYAARKPRAFSLRTWLQSSKPQPLRARCASEADGRHFGAPAPNAA